MNFKKVLGLVFVLMFSNTTVFATVIGPTDTWSYSDYSAGSYCPKSGSLETYFFDSSGQDYAKTVGKFSFDSYNVTNILDYNNGGDNPGTEADGKECFVTIDVSSVREGTYDQMDAYSISTNLPNPKTDLENDDLFGDRNEESEAVALGEVLSGFSYNVTTYWYDYRDGDLDDSGQWQLQFGMSEEGFSDYNNVLISTLIQAIVEYGDYPAQP